MQLQDFTYLLQHPQDINAKQTEALEQLIATYPYFQAPRALYLKALKAKGSFKYNQELKTTAAYTTDRSILFDYITTEAFNQNEISQVIKQNSEHLKDLEVLDVDDITVNKSVAIDDALRQQIKDTEGVLDPDLFKEKPTVNIEPSPLNIAPEAGQSLETQLQIGHPLDFSKTDTHSFSEWLKLTTIKPIDRAPSKETGSITPPTKAVKDTQEETPPIHNKLELIDKFLSDNPKIAPIKDTKPTQNLAKQRNLPNDRLMTETLARIYLEQKNYEKAIQSYKILSLKYPEKSGFFADQIIAIKKIQENN